MAAFIVTQQPYPEFQSEDSAFSQFSLCKYVCLGMMIRGVVDKHGVYFSRYTEETHLEYSLDYLTTRLRRS